jgi:hypothetical protein
MSNAGDRDYEPHRGRTLLFVAALGWVCGLLSLVWVFFVILTLPLGIAGWRMARRDLDKMKAGVMNPDGKNHTEAARLAGIVAVAHGLFACVDTALRAWNP